MASALAAGLFLAGANGAMGGGYTNVMAGNATATTDIPAGWWWAGTTPALLFDGDIFSQWISGNGYLEGDSLVPYHITATLTAPQNMTKVIMAAWGNGTGIENVDLVAKDTGGNVVGSVSGQACETGLKAWSVDFGQVLVGVKTLEFTMNTLSPSADVRPSELMAFDDGGAVNLARSAVVTDANAATCCNPLPESSNDGEYANQSWFSNNPNMTTGVFETPTWLTYDFGQVQRVEAFRIWFTYLSYYTHQTDFQIQASDGAGGWTNLVVVTGNASLSGVYTLSTPVETDKIRVNWSKVSLIEYADPRAVMCEFEILGHALPTPVTYGNVLAGNFMAMTTDIPYGWWSQYDLYSLLNDNLTDVWVTGNFASGAQSLLPYHVTVTLTQPSCISKVRVGGYAYGGNDIDNASVVAKDINGTVLGSVTNVHSMSNADWYADFGARLVGVKTLEFTVNNIPGPNDARPTEIMAFDDGGAANLALAATPTSNNGETMFGVQSPYALSDTNAASGWYSYNCDANGYPTAPTWFVFDWGGNHWVQAIRLWHTWNTPDVLRDFAFQKPDGAGGWSDLVTVTDHAASALLDVYTLSSPVKIDKLRFSMTRANPVGDVRCRAVEVEIIEATDENLLSNDFIDNLGTQLDVPEGLAKFTVDGAVHRAVDGVGEDRAYVRTVDSDFVDQGWWRYELTITPGTGANADVVFMGFGEGAASAFHEEPGRSIFFRIHSPDLAGGRVDVGVKTDLGPNDSLSPQPPAIQGLGNITPGGLKRFRIERDGDTLTFAFDNNYTGTFQATASASLSLSAAGLPLLDASNSHLFFGALQAETTFDDLLIQGFAPAESLHPEPLPLLSGMTQKAVLDEPLLDLWGVQNVDRLVGWLGSNGFTRVDGGTLATSLSIWMTNRIAQGNAYGSVVVMPRGISPSSLMAFTATGKPLWYDYINAGGRIVHIGGPPFMQPEDPNVQAPEFDFYGHSPDPLLGMQYSEGSPYWNFNWPVTSTWAAQNWGLQNKSGTVHGIAAEATTYAFSTYVVPGQGEALGAPDWFRNINLAKPWSGLLSFLLDVDFNNDSALADVWRAAHYVGLGGPMPTMPALPPQISPTSPELLTVDMKNGSQSLSNRHQFVRNEVVTVTTTKDPALIATAVKLVLATTNGTALLTQQTNLANNQATFTVNTAPYAYGPYQLIATALNGTTPVRTNTQPFGVRYVQPEAFNFQVLYIPSGIPARAALEAVDIRDTGLDVFLNITSPVVDLVLSNNLGFIIRSVPDFTQGIVADYNTHPEYFRKQSSGAPYHDGSQPALGVLHPTIRTNAMLQISNAVASVASIPAFRPYVLCNDDTNPHYSWDYTAPNPANFQAATGLVAPTAMTLPAQTGAIADTNAWVQWYRWTFKNVNGGYAKMETRGATNALAGVRIGSQLSAFTYFWGTPEEAQSATAYPPYMCGTNGFNLACNYWYQDYWVPLLSTTYFVELSRMDNRSLPVWNVPNCQWATAAAERSKLFHYLAGGVKGLSYFIYPWRNASMWNELKQLSPVIKRISPVQVKLQPAPRDIGLLCSFPSACFDPNHLWNVSSAYENLIQGHFSVEPFSEDELVAGRASQYKAVLLTDVKYIGQSAYNALQTYISGGGKVLLDSSIPWTMTGASRLNLDTKQTYGDTNTIASIKAAISSNVAPYLISTDIKLVASQLTAGGVPYTWFVNAQDYDEWIFARNKTLGTDGAGLGEDLPGLIAWENAQPTNYTSTISFNTLPGSKPYDLLKGQALTVTTVNGKPTVTVSMQRFGGTLIAWLPKSITALTSSGSSSATRNQANPVTFTATLWTGTSKPPGALPISFTLKNPTGLTNIVSGVRVTTNGVASFQWKPASNDPTGVWQLLINDLTSSRATSRNITLN